MRVSAPVLQVGSAGRPGACCSAKQQLQQHRGHLSPRQWCQSLGAASAEGSCVPHQGQGCQAEGPGTLCFFKLCCRTFLYAQRKLAFVRILCFTPCCKCGQSCMALGTLTKHEQMLLFCALVLDTQHLKPHVHVLVLLCYVYHSNQSLYSLNCCWDKLYGIGQLLHKVCYY